jgi:cyclohexadienyl dehydratase
VFPDNRGIFAELIARHADVMITDDAEADLQSKNHPELCRAFPGTLTHADKAIFMPRDPELLKVVNDWLAAR